MSQRLIEAMGAAQRGGAAALWSGLVALRASWPDAADWAAWEVREALDRALAPWRNEAQLDATETTRGVWQLSVVEQWLGDVADGDAGYGEPFYLEDSARRADLDALEAGGGWYRPLEHFLEISADGRWREVTLSGQAEAADELGWGHDEPGRDPVASPEIAPRAYWFQHEHYVHTVCAQKYADAFDDADGMNTAEDGPIPPHLEQGAAHMLIVDLGESWGDLELVDRLSRWGDRLMRHVFFRWDGVYLEVAVMTYTRVIPLGA